MNRRFFSWIVILLGWVMTEFEVELRAAASTEVVTSRRRDPNPALIYWQSIALLPDLTKADRQLPMDVSGGRIAADATVVSTLLEKVRPALQRFRRASSSTMPCDWGITLDEGPYAVLPHLSKMQFMCRLAAMHGEHLFVKGQAQEALQWMLAVHRAARHVGEGKLLASVLEEYTLDAHALRATARHLKGLESNANLRFGHRQQLDLLPPLHGVSEALRGEQVVAEWLHRMVLGIEQAPNAEAALAEMIESAKNELAAAQRANGKQNQSSDSAAPPNKDILKVLDDWNHQHEVIRKAFDRLRAACDMPWIEAITEIKLIAADPALSIPSVQNLFRLIENHLRKRLETETQQRMLKAALILGPELKPGMISGWQDAFFQEPLVVKREKETLVMTMRQLVGHREISLRLAPIQTTKP